MASIQQRTRRDGTSTWAVLYVIDKRQTSVTFTDSDTAEQFRVLVNTVGARRAMDAWGIPVTAKIEPTSAMTIGEWLRRHIDHLTGCEQKTLDDYNRYRDRDILPFFGDIPLAVLRDDDIGRWVNHLEVSGNSPKTIRNKHGFLSAALAKAVPEHIPSNPAAGRRLPRGKGDADEMRMLTRAEFASLLEATTEPWRPLLLFMVTSGARWGEVAALKPGDVDRKTGAVKIRRAWKYSSNGYEIGPPKTKRSRRIIHVPARVLEQLDYSNEYLFTNRAGGPVRYQGFRRRVWDKAVERAQLDPPPTPHDLRHTCASWMLTGGVPITVVSRHLGHESIKITVDTYGDVDQASAAAAADFMAGALSGATDTPTAGQQPAPPVTPTSD
jgi:integrase